MSKLPSSVYVKLADYSDSPMGDLPFVYHPQRITRNSKHTNWRPERKLKHDNECVQYEYDILSGYIMAAHYVKWISETSQKSYAPLLLIAQEMITAEKGEYPKAFAVGFMAFIDKVLAQVGRCFDVEQFASSEVQYTHTRIERNLSAGYYHD